MSKNVERNGMYETNSSSVHSIVYKNIELEPSKLKKKHGYTIINFGEFGKEYGEYYNQETKLMYLASLIWYAIGCPDSPNKLYESYGWGLLEDAVCHHEGNDTLGIRIENWEIKPEIDHQSVPWGGDIEFINLYDTEYVRQFIYCPNIGLRTDCD